MMVLRIATLASLFFCSCSISKKLERSAKEKVLGSEALQTAHIGISIYEPATGKRWYDYQGDKYFVPASNTKIPTCYAAMKYLGDSLVGFRYNLEGGQLVLTPAGDPTFLHPDFSAANTLAFLRNAETVAIEIDRRPLSYFGAGWSAGDYLASYMAERSTLPLYGNMVRFFVRDGRIESSPRYFAQTLVNNIDGEVNGFGIVRQLEANNFHAEKGGDRLVNVPFHTRDFLNENIGFDIQRQLLGDTLKKQVFTATYQQKPPLKLFHSQPTDSLLKPLMHRSDNFFAEQALLMVSNERLGYMSDEKIIDTLLKTDFADLPQKPRWADGSGLSRYNLFTPQDFVAILQKMKNEFGAARIREIFPTGGEGTLSSYYNKDSGFIYAKTGTLSGVVALSGFLYTKKGKELIFSVLVNNHQASATAVRRAVEAFLQNLRQRF